MFESNLSIETRLSRRHDLCVALLYRSKGKENYKRGLPLKDLFAFTISLARLVPL